MEDRHSFMLEDLVWKGGLVLFTPVVLGQSVHLNVEECPAVKTSMVLSRRAKERVGQWSMWAMTAVLVTLNPSFLDAQTTLSQFLEFTSSKNPQVGAFLYNSASEALR